MFSLDFRKSFSRCFKVVFDICVIIPVLFHLKVSGLTQYRFILLTVLRSEVHNKSHKTNIKMLAGPHSFWNTPGWYLFLCLCQLLETTCPPWPTASCSILKSIITPTSAFIVTFPSSNWLYRRLLIRMLVIMVHAHLLMQETLPVSRSSIPPAKSLCHIK